MIDVSDEHHAHVGMQQQGDRRVRKMTAIGSDGVAFAHGKRVRVCVETCSERHSAGKMASLDPTSNFDQRMRSHSTLLNPTALRGCTDAVGSDVGSVHCMSPAGDEAFAK